MTDEDIASDVRQWLDESYKIVRTAVAASGKAQPPLHDEENGPKDYFSVTQTLLKSTSLLSKKLWKTPINTLTELDTANDTLLERLEIVLSRLEGRPAIPIHKPQPHQPHQPPQSTRMNSSRPQLLFEDKIDNSDSPWIPRLINKHHAIEPFQLEPVHGIDKKKICMYKHPYAVELKRYVPSKTFTDPEARPNIRLKTDSETPFEYIDTLSRFEILIEHLETVSEIAVDLEHHSYRSYQGFTCLIQISTETGGDFIVDALTLRQYLYRLNDAFTNPNILKVFHGADHDVLWLQRDFGVYVVGLFDTYRAAIELGLYSKSLQSLLKNYCKITTNKSLRLADWRMRPLKRELLEYARTDTHSLLFIWRTIRDEILKSGENGTERLLNVFNESKIVCLSTYSKPKCDEEYVFEFYRKSKKIFDSRQMAALRRILYWRDETAREEDESISYVLPNHMVLQLISEMPKETAGIIACCYPTPPLVLHHLNIILQIINLSRSEPIVKETPKSIIENITESPKSIHVYSNQTLKTYTTKPDILTTVKSLKEIRLRSKKDSLLLSRTVQTDPKIKNETLRFVSPFHRRILVKKYNETIKEDNVLNVPTTDDTIEQQTIIDIPEVIFIKPGKRKPEGDQTDKEKSENEKIPTKKLRKEDNEETPIKPFDYKSYDYNLFNKNSRQNQFKKHNPKFRNKK